MNRSDQQKEEKSLRKKLPRKSLPKRKGGGSNKKMNQMKRQIKIWKPSTRTRITVRGIHWWDGAGC